MTSTRQQLRATCPACFATQAVRNGRLAAHGYRRPQQWHQNIGTCSGAGRQHFGTVAGRDYTASLATQLRTQADQRDATAVQVLAGTAPVWSRKRMSAGVYMPVVMDNPTQADRIDYARGVTFEAKQMRMAAADFDQRVAGWAPADPVPVQVATTPAVLIHLYDAGRRGKACASSYMGASRGATSSDLTHVTCQKCLDRHAARLARAAAAGTK